MVAIWDDAVQERFNAFRSRTSVQTSLNEMRYRCCFAHKLKKKITCLLSKEQTESIQLTLFSRANARRVVSHRGRAWKIVN